MTATAKTLPTAAFAALTIISCLAFLGNFLVLLVVILRSLKKFPNSTTALIGTLALTDLIYSGVSMPLTLAASTMGQSWTLGNSGCKLVMFLPNFCIAASILTMIAIAHDRRVAVIKSKPQFNTTLQIISANVAIWIVSLLLAAPALYEYSEYEKEYYGSGSGEIKDDSGSNEIIGPGFNPNDTYLGCGSHGIAANFEKVYATILFVLAYILPLVVISGNYLLIWLFIRKKAKEISSNLDNGMGGGGGGGAISKGKSKILKMLFMVVFVFAVAWAPYFTIFVREMLRRDQQFAYLGCGTVRIPNIWTCLGNLRSHYWRSETDNTGYWSWAIGEPRNATNPRCLMIDTNGDFLSTSCDEEKEVMLACVVEATLNVPTTEVPASPTTTLKVPTTKQLALPSRIPNLTTEVTSTIMGRPTNIVKTNKSTRTGGPVPRPQRTMRYASIIGIVICVVIMFMMLGCFVWYAYTHPSSIVGRCLLQCFGRRKGRTDIQFQRADRSLSQVEVVSDESRTL